MTDPLRRPWPNAQERAWIYREQLESIKGDRLRACFLEMITEQDPAARKLMR